MPHTGHRGALGSWELLGLGHGPGPGLLGRLRRQVSGDLLLWRLGLGGAGAAKATYGHALLSNRMFSATFSSSLDVLDTPGLPKGLKVTLRPRLWVLVA